MGAAPRFFFVHLQKTGGTALFQRLRKAFGASAVYPRPEDDGGVRAVTEIGHLVEQLHRHHSELRVITGHFPLCTVDVIGEPFTTFTMLRDPVERTLSLLRRRSAADPRFQGWDLEDIYADPSLRPVIDNHMVKMLSLAPEELTDAPLLMPMRFDEARLRTAEQHLEHRVDAFGVQERYEEFCTEIATRFGWDLGPARFANRTTRSPVTAAFRDRIAADNELDVELYRFATALLDRRAQPTAETSGREHRPEAR